jgi:hypothetical protein
MCHRFDPPPLYAGVGRHTDVRPFSRTHQVRGGCGGVRRCVQPTGCPRSGCAGWPYLKVTELPVPVMSVFRLLPVTVRAMESKLARLIEDFPAWVVTSGADPMAWEAVRRNGTEVRILVALDLDQLRHKMAAAENEQA